jgi:hypothetical protein
MQLTLYSNASSAAGSVAWKSSPKRLMYESSSHSTRSRSDEATISPTWWRFLSHQTISGSAYADVSGRSCRASETITPA